VDERRANRGLVTLECPKCHNIIEVLPTSVAWCSRGKHKTAQMKEVKNGQAQAKGR
jgi:hypothetical protein